MTVPLHKVLETFLVLKDGAEAAERDTFERVVTVLDKVKQDLDTLNVKEVQLGSLVAKDGVLEAVECGQDESCRVARLVDLAILHVVLEDFDATLATEHFLAIPTLLANV